MASSLYKWLKFSSLLPFIALSAKGDKNSGIDVGAAVLKHPFHVSIVEINHNTNDKSLEITCKLFTDDFEKILTQNYKTKVDLIHPPVKKTMDTLVKKYISAHFLLRVDGLPVHFSYLGFEHERDAVYAYIGVDNIANVRKLEIVNSILHDLFTDQVNLMHIMVGGKRKSMKLDYPQTVAKFEWE